MASKFFIIFGLILVLIGTGIMGFKIPRKGDIIKAPNLTLMRIAIGMIILGNVSQIIGTVIS